MFFDVVWLDSFQNWIVCPSHVRDIKDIVILRDFSEAEAIKIADEANFHRYRGTQEYVGWIPPHPDEIDAVCAAAGLVNSSRSADIRRAIFKACSSFGEKNGGFAPKLRVISVLAEHVLPAYDDALEEWNRVQPWKPLGGISLASWNSKRAHFINEKLKIVCDRNGIVPPDRWWIQDMLKAYNIQWRVNAF